VAQEERSERSRTQILDAALRLFSSQGYRGTSMRDIALAAKVSTGNVYHQFPDKESLFRTLLERYFEILASPDHPLNRALASGAFPEDLEALGRAAREGVRRYRAYVALIYVDVVEFEGLHIRRFYREMASRFKSFLEANRERVRLDRLRPGVSPIAAVMLATRFFLHYFAVELVFKVPHHFGKDTDEVLRETVDILAHGMLHGEAPR
jgi:AcrR family transcriptional regulator